MIPNVVVATSVHPVLRDDSPSDGSRVPRR